MEIGKGRCITLKHYLSLDYTLKMTLERDSALALSDVSGTGGG